MTDDNKALLKRITIVDGLMGSNPTIRGQRFRVTDVLELLQSGMDRDQILKEHPILEKEDIDARLYYAILQVNKMKYGGDDV